MTLLLCALLGMYWIDPNGGHSSDAFKVECDFDGGSCATCIEMQAQVHHTL